MKKQELRFTGSGGQGVILGTVIIAEAAFYDGKQAAQSQSYGPEARGGLCKAECIIDENPITFTKVGLPSLLLSLTQASFDKYSQTLADDAIVVVDDQIEVPDEIKKNHKVYRLHILLGASDVIKNNMAANIISVGAVNQIVGVSSVEALEEAVLAHVPKGTEEINLKALHYGMELVVQADK
ncbi:MAG: 2-oxoacid:acceptor oxidoreductase family protein [Clostridia bacterium]|nr:2-oxoacid:acceptor oxidoreductase family protein [Clostridia bacterium]